MFLCEKTIKKNDQALEIKNLLSQTKKTTAIMNAAISKSTVFLGKKKAAIKQKRIRQIPNTGKSHRMK